jgi:hypothetical protein
MVNDLAQSFAAERDGRTAVAPVATGSGEQAHRIAMMEAGELPGISERQFRRYRDPYEEDGLAGLVDRRLGKPSPKRVPAAAAELTLELYGGMYRGWNVKHFHEHLMRDHGFRWGYT